MNYCTIDEAWGNNILKDSRKKKKTKRLYTSKVPPHVYDTSYEEGSHDSHCHKEPRKNYTVKNKHRFDKSRGPKDLYRPKRSSRVDNINLRYDEANKEYKRYRKETKRNTKNQLSPEQILEEGRYPPMFTNSNTEMMNFIDGDEVAEFNPMQENDMELDYLPEGSNLSESYTIQDNDLIQKKMMDMRKEQSLVLEEQRQMISNQRNQSNNSGLMNSPQEPFDNYYQNTTIEPFEGNNDNLDLLNLEETERVQQIEDVDVRPAMTPNNNMEVNVRIDEKEDNEENHENIVDKMIRNKNKNNKKKRNNQNKVKLDVDVEVENTDSEDSDSENEEEEELKYVGDNSGDLEYRLNNLNRNMNLIIKKMNTSQMFDGDTEENIHDIILFVLFGIFIIFVLDTIYRFGKNSPCK